MCGAAPPSGTVSCVPATSMARAGPALSSANTRGMGALLTSMLTVPSVSLATASPVRARLAVPALSFRIAERPGMSFAAAIDSTIDMRLAPGSQENAIRTSSLSGVPYSSDGASGLSSKIQVRGSCAAAGARSDSAKTQPAQRRCIKSLRDLAGTPAGHQSKSGPTGGALLSQLYDEAQAS